MSIFTAGEQEVKSIVLDEKEVFSRKTAMETLDPGEGEAIVKVGAVGVCGTDYHAYGGNQALFSYPRIIGHELAVEVLAVGAGVENVKVGQKCSVEPYINCGDCIACKQDKGNCCQNIQVLGVHRDGGLRTKFCLPARKLHPTKSLSFQQLAVVEPLCIGAHSIFRAQVKPGENVLVVGAGPVGMGAAQFALAAGGNVCCLDINDQRLEFVRDNVGVKHIVNAIAKEGEPDSIEKLKAIFGGDLPTCVIEATGSKFSMEKAFEFVASGGRICFVGFIKGQITYDNPLFHQREMTIMGSRNALGRDFAHTIKMIEDGKVDVTPWVTHTCKFDDFEENFKTWLDPATGVIKALVIMDE